ncbi:hypothetical protein CALCODRAFT_484513 [Calocera cornea HHB12733]|uniref:TPR-like protein n=1 Tax=Calocera cornea HHB12733 TaxID=1353952 RepID=A0A165EXU1_9BASI|nr:hypothetical protein CALCODRAFT_484513 [Calocera cornea HHB12733]
MGLAIVIAKHALGGLAGAPVPGAEEARERERNTAEALSVCGRVRESINNGSVFQNMGHCYYMLEQFQKAIESMTRAGIPLLWQQELCRSAAPLSFMQRRLVREEAALWNAGIKLEWDEENEREQKKGERGRRSRKSALNGLGVGSEADDAAPEQEPRKRAKKAKPRKLIQSQEQSMDEDNEALFTDHEDAAPAAAPEGT